MQLRVQLRVQLGTPSSPVVLACLGLMVLLALVACGSPTPEAAPTAPPTVAPTATPQPSLTPADTPTPVPVLTRPPTATPAPASGEVPIVPIPLDGPIARSNAEISGLAWYGETLILLPQYPNFAGTSAVYALPKAEILAFLDGEIPGPLTPVAVPFSAPGLAGQIGGFEGYEAIAFAGERAFLTIEASPRGGMKGYLVAGRIAPDLSALVLEPATLAEIPPQSGSGNKADEALFVAGERLVTVYEVNGTAVNPAPVAHLFGLDLAPAGTVAFPNIEYRITDATALDGAGRFWALNYYFPGDMDLLPESDPLAERYGQDSFQAQAGAVERLVEFQYTGSGISLADRPPLQLVLADEALGVLGRNWEGLVRLDGQGFLVATDKFPETILAFVALP